MPCVNLESLSEEMNFNMVTCGGQATVPIAYAINQAADSEYTEIISCISSNYGFSQTWDMELIEEAVSVIKHARLGALLIPGIGTITDLKEAYQRGVRAVRIVTHVTEADMSLQHIKAAKDMGMFTAGFLMMVHMAEPEQILEQAGLFKDAGVDYVNLADSAGHLLPEEVRKRVSLLSEKLSIPVGFHAQNNLGLAAANFLAAVEERASYIDGACAGDWAQEPETARLRFLRHCWNV